MYIKKKNFNATILIVVLIITTIASMGWYFLRPQAPAAAIRQLAVEQQQPAIAQAKPANTPIVQPASDFPQSQTSNGVTVDLVSAKLIKTGVEIGVCYSTPDDGEWYPTPGNLYYSTWEILPDEAEFVSEKKTDGINQGQRCALIRYRIDDLASITMPIKFSLLGIFANPREGSACKDFQHRVDTNLHAKAYGLKINCTEDDHGRRNVKLADHDKAVSNLDAQKVLDGMSNDTLGSWEFSITNLQK